MLFIYLGYALHGLWVVMSVLLKTNEFDAGQLAFVGVLSIFFELPLMVFFALGRKLSKSASLSWISLMVLGALIGIIEGALINLGVLVSEPIEWNFWFAGAMFFGCAFLPKQIEFWRKAAPPQEPS